MRVRRKREPAKIDVIRREEIPRSTGWNRSVIELAEYEPWAGIRKALDALEEGTVLRWELKTPEMARNTRNTVQAARRRRGLGWNCTMRRNWLFVWKEPVDA